MKWPVPFPNKMVTVSAPVICHRQISVAVAIEVPHGYTVRIITHCDLLRPRNWREVASAVPQQDASQY